MNRYRIRISVDGKRKLYYIEDQENYDIVLLPSKYLKHKADANRSPNTVRRLALSICYYLNYLDQTGTELLQVAKKSFEEQSSHFGQFLYWLVEGRHITDNRTAKTGNGTCNAYLKDVFGFFLYLADNGYTEPLRVLAYNQITVSNAVGVKRTIRSKSFKGYLKEKDRNVRAAQEPEIIDILRACTNLRDQLLLLLLAETGFRIGEILGVDYTKDIDYEKQVLKVYFRDDNDNEARAKNAEYRSAKISRETFEFLLHYLAEYRRLLQRQSLLFINIRGETAGKPMRVESVYDMLDRMEEKTGIKLTPHMLRRYYAVSRRDAGWALDVWMQNNILFDGIMGVSAGALFGMNYKSKQPGRVLRYNKKYAGNKNYMGLYSLLTTGDIMNRDFCFRRIVHELDPVDFDTYRRSKEEFYAVVTNMETGQAEYIKIDDLRNADQIEYLRASGSMPFVSKPVCVNGKKYLDGGIADSIPIDKMLSFGYDRVVVVLTRPEHYRKKKTNALMPKLYYRKYPALAEAINNRYVVYNRQLEKVNELEKAQKAFVLRPSRLVPIKRLEKDPEKMQEMYNLGREDAARTLQALAAYLNPASEE